MARALVVTVDVVVHFAEQSHIRRALRHVDGDAVVKQQRQQEVVEVERYGGIRLAGGRESFCFDDMGSRVGSRLSGVKSFNP
ncbi:hypothetical protein GCM10025770_18030 [Viridibacterium curvum]|uniref:Uncharacterized protein n=1 Tax=Viridibacterium curvum TaxID=1101404 RepID=A0ABP9QMH8_9RHOO